ISNDPDAATVLGIQIGRIRAYQGRHDELAAVMQPFVETRPHQLGWRGALAYAYGELDRFDEARENFDVLASRRFNLDQNWSWSSGAEMCVNAYACASLRDRDAAAVL